MDYGIHHVGAAAVAYVALVKGGGKYGSKSDDGVIILAQFFIIFFNLPQMVNKRLSALVLLRRNRLLSLALFGFRFRSLIRFVWVLDKGDVGVADAFQ